MPAAQLPRMNFGARLHRLREAEQLDRNSAFLVTDPANVRYLTGFAGSAGMLLVLADEAILLTDSRYAERAAEELAANDVPTTLWVGRRPEILALLGSLGGRFGLLLCEAGHVTLDFHADLVEALPGATLVPVGGALERLRLIKEPAEVDRLALAARISSAALAACEPILADRPTEREFAAALETAIRNGGADGISFDSIVASGPNAARPHAAPSDRIIGPGELVIVDFGAEVDGYHADMTRTVWTDELPDDARQVYALARQAEEAGVAAALAGASHADVDRACRAPITRAGLDDALLHPSGHNVGLAVHELPYLTAGAEEPLRAGQVITVEPGVYRSGAMGARIEDMLLITDEAPTLLTHAPVRTPSTPGQPTPDPSTPDPPTAR